MFEKLPGKIPSFKSILKNNELNYFSNAFIAFLFMYTGPIAILLSAAQIGGLSDQKMISWFFAGYGLGGIFSIALSLLYRQPISIAWSLPAAAIVGVSLQHLSFPQVVGAYLVTGVLITLLSLTGMTRSLTGMTRKGMELIPVPIIMGMIAGVFLPFCLKMVSTFAIDPWLAAITVVSFFVISASKTTRKPPPILISAIIGFLILYFRSDFDIAPLDSFIIKPAVYWPEFNLKAILELVFPLTISVIGIQNTQGIAILRNEGYEPPINVMTLACGLGTIIMGLLGSVPACLTGPVSAILNTSGKKQARYIGSLYLGIIIMLAALLSPAAIKFALMIPTNLITILGGLVLLSVLQDAFKSAFSSKFTLGALMAFLVTVSNVTFFNISSAFWGLIAGCCLSLILEIDDFKDLLKNTNRHNKSI